MRITKEPEERKKEIILTAQKLFQEKGYTKTTISDITSYMNVAKGTFYYYFKSKEEVIEEIAMIILDKAKKEAEELEQKKGIKAVDKIRMVFRGDAVSEDINMPLNSETLIRLSIGIIKYLSPIFTSIIKEGIKEGDFKTENVHEKVEFTLAGLHFILSSDLFAWTKEEQSKRLRAYLEMFEDTFGMKTGSLTK
jgi:AcrR family transcriptional regulator